MATRPRSWEIKVEILLMEFLATAIAGDVELSKIMHHLLYNVENREYGSICSSQKFNHFKPLLKMF